ncbi:MAG: protein kinase [Pirellulales bacterium]|nr:protein kinase [Pirellulales bacterium]
MNLHATKVANTADSDAGPSGSPVPSAPVGRFTYASGAKPLQGYTLKRGIGHGGFGEVYYATSDAGKEVALKLIRRNWDVELRGVNHCLNLKHPNLLALYDVRQDAHDDHWVVMELMSGESLEDVLQRQPNGLPVEEALAWMHGLAAGVAYLHDHGIVHRDLKPGNIFVDEGIIKIGDYGLSKFISCSRRSGQTGSVGTVHYMAPEVANGRYGKEIDIYALGIILYEMLTGHVPFEGESVGEILMKHLTAEPDVNRLAEPYRTIVARALAKDPAKRFSTVEELLKALPPAPTGAALTAAARYAGPNEAVGQHSLLAGGGNQASKFAAGNHSHWTSDTNANGHNRRLSQPVVNPASLPLDNLPSEIPPPLPKSLPQEPVLRWIRQSWSDLAAWWERMNFQPWQKLLILLGLGLVAFNFMPLWLPIVVAAAVCYSIYRIVRALFGFHRQPRDSISRHSDAAQSLPNRLRESPTRRRWRHNSTAHYEPGTPRERVVKLLASLLGSAVVVAVMSLVMAMLRGSAMEMNQYAWLVATSLMGSWAVLLLAKLWEGRRIDSAVQRFTLLVAGIAVGAISFFLMQWLMVSLPPDPKLLGADSMRTATELFNADGSPRLIALVAYYGFVFVVVRWWKLADPMRQTRLSLWSVALAVFWSYVINLIWIFPQPWGMMTAATIAVAVQMASPCAARQERDHRHGEGDLYA